MADVNEYMKEETKIATDKLADVRRGSQDEPPKTIRLTTKREVQ